MAPNQTMSNETTPPNAPHADAPTPAHTHDDAAADSCCDTAKKATCCEPAAKPTCCGPTGNGQKGCC